MAKALARRVPAVLAVLAFALLVTSVALVFVPVKVPREGDSSSFRCPSAGHVATCEGYVMGRLRWAAATGMGAGLFALLAFSSEVGIYRGERDPKGGPS